MGQNGFSKCLQVALGSVTGAASEHQCFKPDAGSYRKSVEVTKQQGGLGELGVLKKKLLNS